MIMSVRFCLSYDLLNVILSPSKLFYFNGNLHCSNGRHNGFTCSSRKWYVTCGHNIIYDITLRDYPLNNSKSVTSYDK